MTKSLSATVSATVMSALFLWVSSPVSSIAETVLTRAGFADEIEQRTSRFLALEVETGERCVLEGSDLETRHAPWSTFKIPNTLIALETGIVGDIDAMRRWEPARRPAAHYWPDDWRQDQTLQSAFRRSAVWYYQDLALEVGTTRYRDFLSGWSYGNTEVPDGSDAFWLGGPLAISINEQVRFLERLLTGKLEVQQEHLAELHSVAQTGNHGELTLYGKSGAGPSLTGKSANRFEGWFVGWLGREGVTSVVFAHHAQGPSFSSIRTFRQDFARRLLEACGFR